MPPRPPHASVSRTGQVAAIITPHYPGKPKSVAWNERTQRSPTVRIQPGRPPYPSPGSGNAVVLFTRSMLNRLLMFLIGTAAISRL